MNPSFQRPDIVCKICGEKSHVTIDCPQRNNPQFQAQGKKKFKKIKIKTKIKKRPQH